jgi:hypothetical protein
MNVVVAIVGGALAGGALGALSARRTSPLVRLLQWTVALAFAVGCLLRPELLWRERTVAAAIVDLPPGSPDAAVLAAAANVPAAATALQLHWHGGALPPAAASFGAHLGAPRPLPLAPESVQLRLPVRPEVGRPFALEVQTQALATPVPAQVRVRSSAAELAVFDVMLGGPTDTVELLAPQAGALAVELRAKDGDRELVWHGTFAIAASTPVLVLEPSGLAAAALQAQGVPAVVAETLPEELRSFAAVVLGVGLAEAAQDRLVHAVQDGVGLFVVGAGLPAPGTHLHELLPLRVLPSRPDPEGPDTTSGPGAPSPIPPATATPSPPQPPDAGPVPPATPVGDQPIEVDKHAIAMVLLVDRSGSMGAVLADGRSKMSYAKSSALRTAAALGKGDQVAIVTFGTKNEGRVELPLTDVTASAAVLAGCERLAHANELTFLQASPAAVKHVVVISDGEFDRNEGVALGALANRMREQAKATLSVISIIDPFTSPTFKVMAERLARDGGGQFVTVSEPGSVPAFVAAEVTRSLERVGRTPRSDAGAPAGEAPKGPPPARSEPPPQSTTQPPVPPADAARSPRVVVRAVADSTLLLPAPLPEWPTLAQARPGAARLDAQVLLVAGDDGWPLLAFTNRGLGRVGAFAADLFGADAAEFRAEAGFPARLAAWLQSLRPAVPEPIAVVPVEFEVTTAAPTPAEHAAWLAFAGAAAPNEAPPPSVPAAAIAERTAPAAPLAGFLVAALVALVASERWRAARARAGVASARSTA